jgi:hypothetical protein
VQTATARRLVRAAQVGAARASARWRNLPDVLIIGTQRGGTTCLYDCLTAHPAVRRPYVKEMHYFTDHWQRGEDWYRAHFPLVHRPGRNGDSGRADTITIDATPYYLFHPRAAQRAVQVVPHARVIALLRDPADRAYSHYRHSVRWGWETLPFEAALEAEPHRVRREHQRLIESDSYQSTAHRVFSYASRGRYAEQLGRWLSHFPREQVLVLRSEDLFDDTVAVYERALEFLNLAPAIPDLVRASAGRHQGHAPPSVHDALLSSFDDDRARLSELVGAELQWG